MRKPIKRQYPVSGRIITGASIGGTTSSFDQIEILGGNVIAVLTTSIVNHEEEPTITYRGIFKDADEPIQLAPKPLNEYVWVDILGESIGDLPSQLDFNSLSSSQRQQIRDWILLPNNLGIGLKNGEQLVWVGVYVIPYSANFNLTSDDAVADFFASIPRGTLVRSRFDFSIEINDWDGKDPGDPPRSEKIYMPWSN